MKKIFFTILFFISSFSAIARHVAGGELFYEYLGPGVAGTSNYKITLRLFRDCSSSGPFLENENVTAGIYANNVLVISLPLPLIGAVNTISLKTSAFPCLVGSVNVCYQMATYSSSVNIPDNSIGYTLSRIGCCRVDRVSNLSQISNVGSNYVTKIPGTATLATGHNSSPQFLVKDTALVCANKSFILNFGAEDPDKDVLTYSFCDAFTSGSGTNNLPPPNNLNLVSLPYGFSYSGSSPLGPRVQINPTTGIISGIAPPEGQYVVNVCITEWRNGKAFSEHRKDFILKVQNCDFIEAVLPDKIIQCKDSVVHFENLSTSAAIISYLWEFGDKAGSTSTNPTVDFHYSDTGRYLARLSVVGPKGCQGSDSMLVLVYPGFTANFTITGSCFINPFQFTDKTFTKYGIVDSWRWNFGDETTDADTSIINKPTYTYLTPTIKNIGLVVTNSKGCIDSLHLDYTVRDKPVLQLPFKDTLICSIDSLIIPVSNSGIYSWLPIKNILLANTSSPIVFPKDTTRYIVSLNDNGCINTDTVTINVLPFIKVKLGKDSLICQSDVIQLRPVSEALGYQWKSSSGVTITNVKTPLVQPLVNTKYYVIANLGKCQDRDSITINVAPYPIANAGPDTTICYGSRIQLRSMVTGENIIWSPSASLINANITSPIAGPFKTTAYILRVSNNTGCLKSVSDTIIVNVAPKVIANAGNDTFAIPNQPLQLIASGGQRYIWSPEATLSNPSIFNPIATLDFATDSIRYQVRVYDNSGCFSEDNVLVRVFKTGPEIFVPTAFTPNGDGKNDVLKPITVGISILHYFRVYNRWGELLFSTSEIGKGWDGHFKNVLQPSTSYIFATEGIDYQGKPVYRKGTTVLIR